MSIYDDRVQRVYLDTSRPAIYGEYVWKVEYSPAYSYADRWFTTEQEALDYAAEQEGRRKTSEGRER